jgi:DNA-directed RNA polymerase subunit L
MYTIPHSQMNEVTPKIQMNGLTQNTDRLHESTTSISTRSLRKAVLNVFLIRLIRRNPNE